MRDLIAGTLLLALGVIAVLSLCALVAFVLVLVASMVVVA